MNILAKTKEKIDERYLKYDSEAGLIRMFFNPNYHSNLKPGEYCKFASNLEYAAAIFACEYEKHYKMANSIIRTVISHQCKSGDTYGLWSYFLEESLEEMVAPDWNYADFSAIPMLSILKDHADALEDGMYELMRDSCLDACRAILKRDLTITYTNPAVMDTYVTMVCGELFDRKDLFDYGKRKLDRIYYHIMDAQTFDEYNCPGYSLLIANIFSIMVRHIKDNDALDKINALNYAVWKMLGEHFHNKTGEFAGPNLRQYTNFITPEQLMIYEKATGAKLVSNSDELFEMMDIVFEMMDIVYDAKCPEELLYLFKEDRNIESMKLITEGKNFPWFDQACVDTQYMTPDYCLGSFSLMDGWNQHRTVVAYLGDKKEKYCLRLRVLHNNYDFCSAFIATAQKKGSALSVVNFHTNRGDTHVDLDPVKNATINANDLRVRYQIEANVNGITDKIDVKNYDNKCELKIFDTTIVIEFSYSEMTDEKPYFEVTKEGNEIFADMVLYHGEDKDINFSKLQSAVTVSSVSIGKNDVTSPEIIKDDKYITVNQKINGTDAQIRCMYKPAEQILSVMETKILIDGERIEALAEKNK